MRRQQRVPGAPQLRITGALVIELRDFAVAAALAAQAFNPAAATVAGVYGVLMLITGAAAVELLPTLGPMPPPGPNVRRPAKRSKHADRARTLWRRPAPDLALWERR